MKQSEIRILAPIKTSNDYSDEFEQLKQIAYAKYLNDYEVDYVKNPKFFREKIDYIDCVGLAITIQDGI